MSYEYPRGLGAAGMVSGGTIVGGTVGGSSGGSGGSVSPILTSTRVGTQAAPSAGYKPAVFMPKAEPVVPSGSVKTKFAERVELKEWCKLTLGQNSSFYTEKLRNDPSFTYMNTNVLVRYRNSVAVVSDMLRGFTDPAVTFADVLALKAWWLKCHPDTWYIFKARLASKPLNWVPKKLSEEFKKSYRVSGRCPGAIPKKALFEYLKPATATALNQAEVQRKRAEESALAAAAQRTAEQYKQITATAEQAAAAAKRDADAAAARAAAANQAAQTSRTEADAWKAQASQSNQQVIDLQNNLAALQQQISAAPTPESMAALQAQITALNEQLAAANAQAAAASDQAAAADATSQQTADVAAQAEAEAQVTNQAATDIETAGMLPGIQAAPGSFYDTNKWFIWGGAAVAIAGIWWYMTKSRTGIEAPALTANKKPMWKKNWRNDLEKKIKIAVKNAGGRPNISIILNLVHIPGDGGLRTQAIEHVYSITDKFMTRTATYLSLGKSVSDTMSAAYRADPHTNVMIVLTDGFNRWPESPPPGVEVVICVVDASEDELARSGYRVPGWAWVSYTYR